MIGAHESKYTILGKFGAASTDPTSQTGDPGLQTAGATPTLPGRRVPFGGFFAKAWSKTGPGAIPEWFFGGRAFPGWRKTFLQTPTILVSMDFPWIPATRNKHF